MFATFRSGVCTRLCFSRTPLNGARCEKLAQCLSNTQVALLPTESCETLLCSLRLTALQPLLRSLCRFVLQIMWPSTSYSCRTLQKSSQPEINQRRQNPNSSISTHISHPRQMRTRLLQLADLNVSPQIYRFKSKGSATLRCSVMWKRLLHTVQY